MPEVDVNGISVSYTDEGEGSPLVLVCGLGQPASSWELTLAPALRADGFRVVTWDLRGIPPTSVPPPPYAVAEMAQDCIGLLHALDLEAAHLVGYSMGSWIVEDVVLARPDLVLSAVFMGGANRSTAWERIRYPLIAELARRLDPYPAEIDIVDTLANYLSRDRLQEDAVVTAWEQILEPEHPWPRQGRQGQWDAAVAWLGRDDPAGRWGRMGVDALVLSFEHDVDSPPALAEEAASLMPRGRFEMISGPGHLGSFECTDDVRHAITSFVQGLGT